MTNSSNNPQGGMSAPGSSPSEPPLGRTKVGRYNIVYTIAHGGMASVYAGRLPGIAGFEKLVAIKVIHPHLAGEKHFVEMFLDEARLAAGIHHPNVGEIFEVGEDDGLLYMVGDLVLGQNLNTVLTRLAESGAIIPQSLAAHIAARVCLGLHAAHDLTGTDGKTLKLVHRDVTPRNILISYDGFVKLVDFGVAWAQDKLSHTEVGTIKGKISYMAPEQIRGEPLDRRADIFSLGVVLYKMLTGDDPFVGSNDAATMNRILGGDFTPLRKIEPAIEQELERITMKALANSRSERYLTAAEMGIDLETYLQELGDKVNDKTLSSLMRQVFEDKIARHEERLRAHREAQEVTDAEIPLPIVPREGIAPEDDGSATQVATPAAKKALIVEENSDTGETPLSTSYTIDENLFGLLRQRRKTAAIGLGVGAAVLTALLMFLFVGGGAEAPSAPTDVVAPAAPPAIEPPSAAEPEPPQEEAPATAEPELPSHVTIQVDGLPDGAKLTIDGQVMTAPITLPRAENPALLKITARGFTPFEKAISLSRNQTVVVEMKKRSRSSGRGGGRSNSDKKKGGGKLLDNPFAE